MRKIHTQRFWLAIAMTLTLGIAVETAQATGVEDLVLSRRGNLPILLAAPHGGRLDIPDVRKRTNGKRMSDAGTLEVVQALADRVAKLAGAAPYVVAAKFHRKYVDANRSEAEGLEDAAAQPAYREYHRHVREFVDEIRKRFPSKGLLLDIHGQATDDKAIFRGTQNGKTVARVVREQGLDALTGPDSVLGYLEAKGYRVIPPASGGSKHREHREYNGGFTVMTYGSNQADGIDAIQIELGHSFRTGSAFRAGSVFGDDFAVAIFRFYQRYGSAAAPAGAK